MCPRCCVVAKLQTQFVMFTEYGKGIPIVVARDVRYKKFFVETMQVDGQNIE